MFSLHQMPFGAEPSAEGVRFSLWAPDAERVQLIVDGGEPIDVARDGEGFARVIVASAGPGSTYTWSIDGQTGIPDPASRFQPDGVFSPSLVTNPSFEWRGTEWRGRPWEQAVIYEVHVGTATSAGTFDALAERLDAIADLGVTMIELMPIAECPGARNWGYDGVLPFAPNSAYGTPDSLKRLIDSAHSRGIMMMLDVVYNHFGPSGNFLPLYAKSFFTDRHHTPWGEAIDFDAKDRQAVRDFVVHNALYWIDEFRFDGLRLDAVHAINDDSDPHVLTEIAEAVHAKAGSRHVHLVIENEQNASRWLTRDEQGKPKQYNAQWNDDIHHCWHVLLTGEAEAYYEDYASTPLQGLGRCLSEGFAYQGEPSAHAGGKPRGEVSAHLPPQAFVAFLQNHDQIGNRAFGERLSALSEPDQLAIAHALLILSPQIPLLFMGEEWSASTPFQFFVDFSDDPDLSNAVRDGRRREFARFKSFADHESSARIPDPTDEATFGASRLIWEERVWPPHSDVLGAIRHLLALRHEHVVPLLSSGWIDATYEMRGEFGLEVRWRFAGGNLKFLMQLGPGTLRAAADDESDIVWSSAGASTDAGTHILEGWSAVVSKGPARGATR
ncbi:MAG: malto-oligosyltrehalose trehalohydrolase [Hyphomicrobiales bacterium]|nr:malto-oligosyltrehalose trehalohydrolase [Hyphomicrobiales bacterium]